MPGAIKYRPRPRALFISLASYLTIRADKGFPWFANVQSMLQGPHLIRANLRSNLSSNPLFFIHTGLQRPCQNSNRSGMRSVPFAVADGSAHIMARLSTANPSATANGTDLNPPQSMVLTRSLKPGVNEKQQVFLSDRFLHRLGVAPSRFILRPEFASLI